MDDAMLESVEDELRATEGDEAKVAEFLLGNMSSRMADNLRDEIRDHTLEVLRAEDASQLLVNGAPIEVGDEVAIRAAGSGSYVGLGRIGQSFRWDGVHDMIIEVLGGAEPGDATVPYVLVDVEDGADAWVIK